MPTNEQKEYCLEDFYNKFVSPLKPMIEPVMIGDPDEVWKYCEAFAKQEVLKALGIKDNRKKPKRLNWLDHWNDINYFVQAGYSWGQMGVIFGLTKQALHSFYQRNKEQAIAELKNGGGA